MRQPLTESGTLIKGRTKESFGMDSFYSQRKHRYVSWCVDPTETPISTATGATKENHQAATPGSFPRLLLTPPETRGTAHQRSQSTLTKRTANKAFNLSCFDSDSHSDDDGGRGHKNGLNLQHQEDKRFLGLPRSSPVISKGHRPVSWHEGDTSRPDFRSLDVSSSRFLSLSQRENLTATSLEDLRPKTSRTRCRDNSRKKRSSGIPEYSADILKTSSELEQENAHFIVVDMVLEVLEGVKWTLMTDKHKNKDCQSCTDQHTSSAEEEPPQRCKNKNAVEENQEERDSDEDMETSHSFYTHGHTQSEEDEKTAEKDEDDHPSKTLSILSTDSGFEDCGVDTVLTQKESLGNAEGLAQQLVLEFRRSWLPADGPQRGRLSLRSALQELPGTTGVSVSSSSSLKEEIRQRTRMRGSLSWAPPQVELILSVHPSLRRGVIIAQQNFLCAGCGTEIEHKHIKKLRYCEYLGRYFCDCCHSGSEAVIPARVLTHWDFNRFSVSDFSKQLLDSIWFQPLFDLTCVGKTLYSRVKELHRFRELQDQLLGIKKLLRACRLSAQVMTEFEQLPAHLTEQPHLFSMDDLLRVKKGQLVSQARAVLNTCVSHVENCQLCLARGFICEFCRDRDVIFPFQTEICSRCQVCRSCFHKHCFEEKKCPKCARIQSRKNIQKYQQLHTPTNILLLSLAISDFLVGLLMMPLEILRLTTCWTFGDFICSVSNYWQLVITSASIGDMVLISVDRYVAICDPLHYSSRVTARRVRLCVCLCWLCSVLYTGLILKDDLIQPGRHNSCFGECLLFLDVIKGTIDLVLSFIAPITTIFVLYMRVFVVAVSQARAMRSHVTGVRVQLSLHTPTNILLLSLAISDFLVGLLMMPIEILRLTTCWTYGDWMCSWSIYIMMLITSTSIGDMVLISVDRYVAICDPLHYSSRVTVRRVRLCVCLCWLCSVLYNGLILKDDLIQPGRHNSCFGECLLFLDVIKGTIDLVLSFIAPITTIFVLYMQVFVVAVSQARAMRSHVTGVRVQLSVGVTAKKSELKAARTLGVLVVVFLICFCPYYCLSLTTDFLPQTYILSIFIFLFYFNSCLNPVIYALFYSWFRKALKLIVTLQILQPGSCEANMM
ncbi:protein associated with UVRAG as autophagy enhancer [Xyrichtys novacula]|uniref:Protein associated with UVRAG as autophagy enhancer n=1 Tax=Xyrichtys novacula TaxID=13765 RepID=A0AAV1GYZ8_XYRNO|nr:protein associated with UVRAG as autophagy enhancer [Xyrichtys novacula]